MTFLFIFIIDFLTNRAKNEGYAIVGDEKNKTNFNIVL